MSHKIYTITKFEIVAPYTLHLTFDDGVEKTIDLSPVLRGELYAPLRDLEFFNQVKLNHELGTIVWPNEADFDPATLHDWDEVGADMIEMASKWDEVDAEQEIFPLEANKTYYIATPYNMYGVAHLMMEELGKSKSEEGKN